MHSKNLSVTGQTTTKAMDPSTHKNEKPKYVTRKPICWSNYN